MGESTGLAGKGTVQGVLSLHGSDISKAVIVNLYEKEESEWENPQIE